MVQASQGLNEHVHTLISILVAARGEEVKGVLGIEVVVSVKVASDEIMDPFLGLLM